QGGPGLFSQDRRLPISVPEPVRDRNGRLPQSALPTQWSEDLGMVLGWLTAHGGMRTMSKDNTVTFQFGGEDLEMMTYLRPRLNRWFGREAAPGDRRGKGCTLVFRGKQLTDFIQGLDIESARPELRRTPRSIFTAPREAVVGFLRALFTAHGTVSYADGRSTIRLVVRSEQLLKEVQILLLNLGIRSRQVDARRETRKLFVYAPSPLREVRESGYAAAPASEERTFQLEISKDHTARFFERVGFVNSRYKLRIGVPRARVSGCGSFDDEVAKVEPAGMRPVYDLVEPMSRSFVANGIVVHNCGEQPLLPYESCNLGSINLSYLTKREKGREVLDWDRLAEVVRVAVRFLDNVIDANRYPLPSIEEMTKGNRKVGLGVMGFADMLIKMGIPYDSPEALVIARDLMKFIKEQSYAASVELAEARGSFPNFGRSRFRNNGTTHRRNATLTTIAPTGTISIIAGCSSGVEPLFALSYVRNVLDGQQLVEVNDLFEKVARERGFYSEELMKEIARRGSARGMADVPEDVQRVFVTAHDISPEWHIRMQAAFQEHVDNAVSKTVNFPNHATEQDVANVYMLAFQLDCKGVTVYRDGSRESQVLSTGQTTQTAVVSVPEPLPVGRARITPRARPEVTVGSTEKIQTGCGTLYITINEDEDGLCEVFTQMGKSGGCTASQAEATSRMVSLALRTGVDPESIIRQLKGIRCPAPSWQNGVAILSCPDAIGKAIERYMNKNKPMLPGFEKVPMVDKKTPAGSSGRTDIVHDLAGLCPQCPDCGNMLEVIEGCIVCRHCGYSQC
ncbi:MAG: adenosylcobalamin-dependent ribonucleoside-diphosphate reductase, partial [Chloroflexota bacterium]